MSEPLVFHYEVDGSDFTSAGTASVAVKKSLRQLGLPSEVIRKLSIAMYEGEINMVIHASGGTADVIVTEDYVDIVLADTGPGIDPEDLPHLFERFYRGKNADENSVGIGLALARQIVSAQNGTLQAANRPEGGASFTMRFYNGTV